MSRDSDIPPAILIRREGAVAVVTFNRPEAMNSWDRAMRRDVVAACAALEADDGVGAVVFTGAGERAFGAGQDLREAPLAGVAEVEGWVEEWRAFFGAIRGLSKPSVAALNGVAAGSAFQFALMADLRVGHPGIRMGQPEIKSGVASSMGPWIIAAVLGPARAADLALTGRLMDGAECERHGLLHRVVPREAVLAQAVALAAELASRPRLATRLTKERLRALTEPGFRESIALWKDLLRRTIEARDA